MSNDVLLSITEPSAESSGATCPVMHFRIPVYCWLEKKRYIFNQLRIVVEEKLCMAYPLQLPASGGAQGEPSSVPSCLGNKSVQTLLWTGWSCIYTAFKSRGRSRLCSLQNNNNKHHWMRTVWRIDQDYLSTSVNICSIKLELIFDMELTRCFNFVEPCIVHFYFILGLFNVLYWPVKMYKNSSCLNRSFNTSHNFGFKAKRYFKSCIYRCRPGSFCF